MNPTPPMGTDPQQFKDRINGMHQVISSVKGGWVPVENMADVYLQIIQDESLNGAALELGNSDTMKVNVLRQPHIEGHITDRDLGFMSMTNWTKELKAFMTPDDIDIPVKVNRAALNLKNQVALVTGASRKDGIGFNVAKALAQAGYVYPEDTRFALVYVSQRLIRHST